MEQKNSYTMSKNFKCILSYMKGEEGSADQKPVKEQYIVRAVNYTDAETKLHAYAELNGIRDFQHSITEIRITEIIDQNNGADFWLSKTSYIVTSEAGKERTIKETQLVNAKNLEDALAKVKEYFKQIASTVHTRLIGLQESVILDVIE